MKHIIDSIVSKHSENGITINSPATTTDIKLFEEQTGISLPTDFIYFYSLCNGFECVEDVFNMSSIESISDFRENYGKDWFYFSEYMHASDLWGVRLVDSGYEIFNASYPSVSMTNSLVEFLKKFLAGNVFDKNGLYDWNDEIRGLME